MYSERINEVYSRLEDIDAEKPRVYVECGWEGPSEYGNTYGNCMWGALVEKCKGINIAMHNGTIYTSGKPVSVLTPETVRNINGVNATVYTDDDGIPQIIPISSTKHRRRRHKLIKGSNNKAE